MDELTLRPLTLEECAAAAEVVAANPLWRERYRYGGERAAADLRRAVESGDLVLGAFAPRLQGVAWVMPTAGFGRAPYLKLLAVSPDAQSGGVGARLLRATLEHFRARGATRYFLLVSDFNDGAQRFYQREGFAQVGALPDFVLPGVAELVYMARL
jgi:ribosomal protein S18 acetylase RimI-like enzyme